MTLTVFKIVNLKLLADTVSKTFSFARLLRLPAARFPTHSEVGAALAITICETLLVPIAVLFVRGVDQKELLLLPLALEETLLVVFTEAM